MVTFESDGSLTFRVYLPHAESVELVADFTEWAGSRLALKREVHGRIDEHRLSELAEGQPPSEAPQTGARGWWSICLRAPEGDHAFSYLVDNQWWLPDYAAHGVKRNEHGNWTSLLFVPPPPRLAERLGRRRLFGRDHETESRVDAPLRMSVRGRDLGQAV